MAAFIVRGERLVLRLNPLERLMMLRLRSPAVPLRRITNVAVQRRVGTLLHEVDFGFAGNSAPLGGVVTAKIGKYRGGRAACLVYVGVHAVRVDVEGSCWTLLLASSTSAQAKARELRRAVGLPA